LENENYVLSVDGGVFIFEAAESTTDESADQIHGIGPARSHFPNYKSG
jgi:hypothetical protein